MADLRLPAEHSGFPLAPPDVPYDFHCHHRELGNATQDGGNARHHLAAAILRTRFRHRFTVIEVGAKLPGALRRVAWMVDPDVVVVLTVAGTHTQSFRTLKEAAAEKAQLLSRLGPGGLAVLNGDDPRVLAMADRGRFRVHSGGESLPVSTRLVGEHWLASVLAALAVAQCCGLDLESATSVLAKVEPPRGRMEPAPLLGAAARPREGPGRARTCPAFLAAARVTTRGATAWARLSSPPAGPARRQQAAAPPG